MSSSELPDSRLERNVSKIAGMSPEERMLLEKRFETSRSLPKTSGPDLMPRPEIIP
ncbi:MAG: hypothetical protein HGA70_05195, partial [Chlorobiaceae bacterium]|nr:hypothetical protein [Chlorobiaceae bacterium]